MRSEVYFLPPRTSVTDSVGISTLPILPCSPKAATRDSSDSFTLRSNPEYEWMMYHFILGLLGTSAVAFAPSAAGCCPAPSPPDGTSFFSSSCIWGVSVPIISCTYQLSAISLLRLEQVEHIGHTVLNDVIDDSEIQREKENRDDHDRGSALHFLPRGRSHFAHFRAHIVVEGSNLLGPALHLLAKAAIACKICHFLRLD